MADNNDVKSDIKAVYKIINRVDIDDPHDATKVKFFLDKNNIMRSYVGRRFTNRLQEIIDGKLEYPTTCILCKNLTSRSVFCEKCGEVVEKSLNKQEIVVSVSSGSRTDNGTGATVETKAESIKGDERGITYCGNCGKVFPMDNAYCPHCGTPKNDIQEQVYCSKCGKQVSAELAYCPHCGNKLGKKINIDIPKFRGGTKKISDFFKKQRKRLAIAIALIVVLAGVGYAAYRFVPRLLITPEELISEGNFEQAYAKASDKEAILMENLLACLCNDVIDSLKDPTSFLLRDVWISSNKKGIVLEVTARNGFGGLGTSCWLYIYDSDKEEYEYVAAESDIYEEEETYSWDDYDDALENIVINATRATIRDIIDDDSKIEKDTIKRINSLFTDGLLEDVKPLENIKDIYPKEDDEV